MDLRGLALRVPIYGNDVAAGAAYHYRIATARPTASSLITATDAGNPDWITDKQVPGSTYLSGPGGEFGYAGTVTFGPTVPAYAQITDLFRHERSQTFTFTFPFDGATSVKLRLYLMEVFHQGAGQRVFSVQVNGVVPVVYTDLDLYEITGGRGVALMLEHTTTPDSNGDLVVTTVPDVDNPAIMAIEAFSPSNKIA